MKLFLFSALAVWANNPGYQAAHKYFETQNEGSWILSSAILVIMAVTLLFCWQQNRKTDP